MLFYLLIRYQRAKIHIFQQSAKLWGRFFYGFSPPSGGAGRGALPRLPALVLQLFCCISINVMLLFGFVFFAADLHGLFFRGCPRASVVVRGYYIGGQLLGS